MHFHVSPDLPNARWELGENLRRSKISPQNKNSKGLAFVVFWVKNVTFSDLLYIPTARFGGEDKHSSAGLVFLSHSEAEI